MKRGSPAYWNAIRPDVRWTAIDEDGTECGYTEAPKRLFHSWRHDSGAAYSLDGLNVEGRDALDWKNSLLERPYEWQVPDESTPVDAKVWARNQQGLPWRPRHYAGDGRVFDDGCTSWSEPECGRRWGFVVLADPDNPDRKPPDDYMPEGAPSET